MKRIFEPFPSSDFRCLKDRCTDSCCTGWDIRIDSETLDFYRTSDDPMFKDIDLMTREDEGEYYFINRDGRCPFLDERGLCRIHLKYGAEKTSIICRIHPIFVNELESVKERCPSLCCEAATDMIINADPETYVNDCSYEAEDERENFIISERNRMIMILSKNRDFLSSCDLLFLMSQDIQNRYDEMFFSIEPEGESEDFSFSGFFLDESFMKDILSFISSLESSRKDLKDIIKDFTYINTDISEEKNRRLNSLLSHFLFRYMPEAAEDDDIISKTVFSVSSALLIHALSSDSEKNTENSDISLISRLYSREMEYNEENMADLTQFIMDRLEENT